MEVYPSDSQVTIENAWAELELLRDVIPVPDADGSSLHCALDQLPKYHNASPVATHLPSGVSKRSADEKPRVMWWWPSPNLDISNLSALLGNCQFVGSAR